MPPPLAGEVGASAPDGGKRRLGSKFSRARLAKCPRRRSFASLTFATSPAKRGRKKNGGIFVLPRAKSEAYPRD